ncbi:hypothetical protein I314_01809 [Cryptococcus bacillisporus CA1873]|uniref:BRCT domain-containing protein n=1 Tax=Cryptococcus bacillisporus CA1873 TaxID=1296111 RepID=A0ABR5BGN2_CRYGA|nr:hypothetical protein I314_01809 [Cryptococcus bacillisporus CA1873]|eukprot:KIR68310.1 hypothetical protein I314_01809 [Cryptococcus gattii CA1873]
MERQRQEREIEQHLEELEQERRRKEREGATKLKMRMAAPPQLSSPAPTPSVHTPVFHDRGFFLSKDIIQAGGPNKTRLMYLIREKGKGITYPDPLRPKVVYIIVRLDSTCPQDYVALAATDTETFHQCSISSDWTTPNVIKHFARVEEDLPANESSLSINRKYVLREEWVEECIAKKRLIDEREGFGGWAVKVTFDPSLASGPSRASKLSLPAVSAAASAPPSLLARIGSPSVSTPQDGDTSRDAFDSSNLLSRIGSPSIQEAVVGPGNLLSRIGSPSVSLVQHGESSSNTVTLNKDDVEDRHRPRQLYLDLQPRPRSPTQPPPPLAQQLPQRPPTPPMPLSTFPSSYPCFVSFKPITPYPTCEWGATGKTNTESLYHYFDLDFYLLPL